MLCAVVAAFSCTGGSWAVEGCSSAGVQLHVCCRRLRGTFDNRRHQEEANTAASLASETSRVMLAGLLELMWHADEDTLKCKLALIALTYFNLPWITNLVLSCSHAGSLLGCRCLSTKGCHDFALQGVCSWGKELCKSLKQSCEENYNICSVLAFSAKCVRGEMCIWPPDVILSLLGCKDKGLKTSPTSQPDGRTLQGSWEEFLGPLCCGKQHCAWEIEWPWCSVLLTEKEVFVEWLLSISSWKFNPYLSVPCLSLRSSLELIIRIWIE